MDTIGAHFVEQGYYLARGVFSSEEVAGLETDFDRIVEQISASGESINGRWGGEANQRLGAEGTVVLHTHNVQHYSAAWLQALMHKGFLDRAEAILGADIVLHHSKLFQKPPEQGAPFPLHQDWGYFPTENDTMIAAIIHLSPATDDMGCVRVYPGSHRLGRTPGTMGGITEELDARYSMGQSLAMEAEAGDVLFFSYFLLHGSMPNTSSHVRKTVLVQMYAGHDQVEEGNGHPDERLVLRGWNHRATRNRANLVKG
ncbi:MAG: phytanoyl-CoA dioxygenase family protein [Candidatus Latescibacteria bacterium]|nr:phytanoyl-CoA dioxygenase family protein [Candidatus Latescibacterota bacterium]